MVVTLGSASDLADRIEAAGLDGPAILMIGDALAQPAASSAAVVPHRLAV